MLFPNGSFHEADDDEDDSAGDILFLSSWFLSFGLRNTVITDGNFHEEEEEDDDGDDLLLLSSFLFSFVSSKTVVSTLFICLVETGTTLS